MTGQPVTPTPTPSPAQSPSSPLRALHHYDRHLREWSDIGVHLPWLRENAHGVVLEIGVRDGVSTSALLLGVAHSGGHVWSVDIADTAIEWDIDARVNWTFLRADSGRDSAAVLSAMGRRDASFAIDLLFIDGDHTFAGAMADLTAYGPLARTIAIHDTNSNFPGVWEAAIAFFRAKGEKFTSAEFFTSGNGLGVLRR